MNVHAIVLNIVIKIIAFFFSIAAMDNAIECYDKGERTKCAVQFVMAITILIVAFK